jgi:hypothetical protein
LLESPLITMRNPPDILLGFARVDPRRTPGGEQDGSKNQVRLTLAMETDLQPLKRAKSEDSCSKAD